MRVGLFGVPIETVPLQDTGLLMSAYLPHVTDQLRRSIIQFSRSRGLEIDDVFGETADHHDVDADHFGRWIQGVYKPEPSCGQAEGEPERLLYLLGQSRPNKLGFWEYRLRHDLSGMGVGFITNCIIASINK